MRAHKPTLRLLIATLFILLCNNLFSQDLKTEYFWTLPGADKQRVADGVKITVTIKDSKVNVVAICNTPELIDYLSVSFLGDSTEELMSFRRGTDRPLTNYYYVEVCNKQNLENYLKSHGTMDFGVYYKTKLELSNTFGISVLN